MLYFCYKHKYLRGILYFIGGYKRYFRDKSEYQYEPVPTDKRTTFPHNVLWSSSRSGNHWVRFIAEYLTGHPTCGTHDNPIDKPIFMDKFPSVSHPLAHVSGKRPYILYKSHTPYQLLNDSTIILLVRNFKELVVRYNEGKSNIRETGLRNYVKLMKAYDEFSGAKLLIYYEDLLLNPEREILRIKHFLGASDSRYKTFMKHYDYYNHLSRHPRERIWGGSVSSLNPNFHRESSRKKTWLVEENTKYFHQLLADPEYQQVKPYIARYI